MNKKLNIFPLAVLLTGAFCIFLFFRDQKIRGEFEDEINAVKTDGDRIREENEIIRQRLDTLSLERTELRIQMKKNNELIDSLNNLLIAASRENDSLRLANEILQERIAKIGKENKVLLNSLKEKENEIRTLAAQKPKEKEEDTSYVKSPPLEKDKIEAILKQARVKILKIEFYKNNKPSKKISLKDWKDTRFILQVSHPDSSLVEGETFGLAIYDVENDRFLANGETNRTTNNAGDLLAEGTITDGFLNLKFVNWEKKTSQSYKVHIFYLPEQGNEGSRYEVTLEGSNDIFSFHF